MASGKFFRMEIFEYFHSGAYQEIKNDSALLLYDHLLFLMYTTETGFVSNDYDVFVKWPFKIRGLTPENWNEVISRFVHIPQSRLMSSPSIFQRLNEIIAARFSGMKKNKPPMIQRAISKRYEALLMQVLSMREKAFHPTLNSYPFRVPFQATLYTSSIYTPREGAPIRGDLNGVANGDLYSSMPGAKTTLDQQVDPGRSADLRPTALDGAWATEAETPKKPEDDFETKFRARTADNFLKRFVFGWHIKPDQVAPFKKQAERIHESHFDGLYSRFADEVLATGKPTDDKIFVTAKLLQNFIDENELDKP